MSKIARILSNSLAMVLAVILLVSGFAKAADAAYFSDLIYFSFNSYWMAIGTVALILLEIVMGIGLLVQWHVRWLAWAIGAMLVVVTSIYIIGVTRFGMTTCGCFGHLTWLNLGPAGTIIRNIIMLGICIFLILTHQNSDSTISSAVVYLLPLATTIAAFMVGYTMRGSMVVFTRSQGWQGIMVEQSPLRNLELSRDSDYLVFAFSFNCPYCQMAVGNVSLFEQSGVVDRVVGLVQEDSVGENRFRQCYLEMPFAYSILSDDSIRRLAPQLPTTYLINHDTIRYVWTGEVPAPIFVK